MFAIWGSLLWGLEALSNIGDSHFSLKGAARAVGSTTGGAGRRQLKRQEHLKKATRLRHLDFVVSVDLSSVLALPALPDF
jgi:hypothetical protein